MNLNSIKNINDLPSISQTIKEYNLSAKKKLSQNFILDLNLTNKIINLSDGIKDNTIIEIGPGPGSLTRSLLLNGAKKVIALINTELSLITWKCKECNEVNDQTFDFCWKCHSENF